MLVCVNFVFESFLLHSRTTLEFHGKKKNFIKACHDYYNNSRAGNTLEPINPVSNRSLKSGRINKMAVLKGFHRQENGWLSFTLGQNIVAVITR